MKIKKSIISLGSLGLLATITPISSIATNHVTFADSQSIQIQSLDIGNKLTEIKSINKSCEKLVTYKSSFELVSNIDSRVKIEEGFDDPGIKDGIEQVEDAFVLTRVDIQYSSYSRYKCNPKVIKESNDTSWGNAKKYQLNVTVPANTKDFKVQVVADVKIKNCLSGGWIDNTSSFVQAKLSPLSMDPEETLMPYIGIKDDKKYEYCSDNFKIITQNDLFELFYSRSFCETKPHEKAKLSSYITLSNETPEPKEIPIYFWYGWFGGGYSGDGNSSQLNCIEVWFSANHIE